MYSLTFAQLSGLTIHYRRDYLRRRPIYNVTLGYVMGHAVRLSSVCTVGAPCAEGLTSRQYFCTANS